VYRRAQGRPCGKVWSVKDKTGTPLIGAIVLGQEAKIDWKEVLEDQKRIKRQMQLDYLRTGRRRTHIEWR
jgi:hypothetical protein